MFPLERAGVLEKCVRARLGSIGSRALRVKRAARFLLPGSVFLLLAAPALLNPSAQLSSDEGQCAADCPHTVYAEQ